MEIEGYRWQDLERMAQTEQGGGLSSVAYVPPRCNRRKQVCSSHALTYMDDYLFCNYKVALYIVIASFEGDY